jgi:hypothetical protein
VGALNRLRKTIRLPWLGQFVVGWTVLIGVPELVNGDEPGRLGRLFRFGGSSASVPEPRPPATESVHPLPPGAMASVAPSGPQPRIRPQPRVSHAVTEADPIVTRISLARSNDGAQFGMFLQVYADGTVLDSEGVHRLGREGIKEVLSVLETSDIHRVRGHCGTPATDFVEHVQMIVYERNLGRLRASSFSCTGNPQGCDRSVKLLQAALDGLQTKLGRPMPASAPAPAAIHAPAPVISLTPIAPEPSQAPADSARIDLGPVVGP